LIGRFAQGPFALASCSAAGSLKSAPATECLALRRSTEARISIVRSQTPQRVRNWVIRYIEEISGVF